MVQKFTFFANILSSRDILNHLEQYIGQNNNINY